MAVQQINDLTLKATAASTDEIEIQETGGGDSKKTTLAGILTATGAVAKTLYDAQSILVAVADNTPVVHVVPEQEIVGRKTGGDVESLTAAEVRTILNVEDGADVTDATNVDAAGAVMEADYDAQTILMATADNTPVAHVVPEQEIVGRKTGGNVESLTAAEVRTILNVEDGADVTDATNVDAAGAVMEADYDANTILAADADNTPAALTVAEETLVGRLSGGNIDALTYTEVLTALGFFGKQAIWVPAEQMYPETTAGAAANTTTELVAGQPEKRGFAFDASSDEAVQFSVAMPTRWNEGTITFLVYWTTADAGADGVAFALAGKYVGDGSPIAGAFGTPVVVTDDAQSSAHDVLVTAESGALTIDGTPAEGGLCFFRLFRDVSDANDDLAADATVLGVKIFFTPDDVNDA